MDELITRHLNGVTSDIESRALERWRAESSENEAIYRETKALWSLSAGSERRGEDDAERAPEIIIRAAERRRRTDRRSWRAALRSPWTGYGVAAAAVVALLIFRVAGGPRPSVALISPVESTASSEDVVTMSLSDGSVVRLGPSTTIEFPPSPERTVLLSGRAFFAVASDDTPFVVRTSVGDVTVRGTRFEVSTTPDGLRLIVVEGLVSLAGSDASVEVRAGQVAHLDPGGAPTVVDSSDVWTLLDWAGGLLVFQETPLVDVAGEIGRHFGASVEVDEELRARRVTAWFSDEPIEEVMSAVCLVAGAACEVGEETISVGR